MKNKPWMLWVVFLSLGAAIPEARPQDAPAPAPTEAAEARPPAAAPAQKPEPAPLWIGVAKQNNINVRGQAALQSEVVTRLQKGDRVNVLEEVVQKKPKVDEPARWLRIALPTNVFVWVHGDFIDPNNKTVTPNRLNLRGGPGENYSILGRINKGTVVKELEVKGHWLKIEAPQSVSAFVAAHLLALEPPPPPPTLTAAVTPATPPPTTETVVTTDPALAPPAEPTPATPPAQTPAIGTLTPLEGTAAPSAPAGEVAPEKKPERRIVAREGMVRETVSVQAPTYFKLLSLDTGKTINYIHSTNVVLRDYNFQRILITGEELLDERWPNTPVIEIETIRTIP